jgi:hypothetical protein
VKASKRSAAGDEAQQQLSKKRYYVCSLLSELEIKGYSYVMV